LGLNKKFDSLLHHNLFFGADWVKNFDDIFVRGIVGENPSTYVCAPSKTDPSVAPEGCENVFMLTPIAPGIEVNKEEMLEKSLKMLEEKFGMEGVRESIIFSRVFTVEDFVERYNSYKGTALGMAHDLLQTAYFRPKQRSSKVKGLYYVGAGTHPGIGMPMVLLSAQILAKELAK
jgi:phytoene desaturase